MTRANKTFRPSSPDGEAGTDVRHIEPVEIDATVVPVGTFAAGQSVDGRYVAVTAAPQGDFAEGPGDEDAASPPEAAETLHPYDPRTRPGRSARR